MSEETLPDAYQSAVREINTIAQFAEPATARRDLAALRDLIDTLMGNLWNALLFLLPRPA